MDALFVDAHPGAPAAHGALLAGALLSSGADVAYFASEAAPRDLVSERAPSQMRFVLTGGWSSMPAPQRIAAEQLDAILAASTPPLFVVGDGPVLLPARPPAALRAYPGERIWINCVPPVVEGTRVDGTGPASAARAASAQHAQLGAELQGPHALAVLGALMLQPDEVEMAAPKPYLIVERRRGGGRNRRSTELWRRALAAWREWGIKVIERPSVTPAANALSLLELVELPTAMCNTAVDTFLADPAGAELAARLIREGLSVIRRERRPLERLPQPDPQLLVEAAAHGGASTHAAELSAARRGALNAPNPRVFAPNRNYGRILQSYLRGQLPAPPPTNELLLTEASRKGLNLTANGHVVQRSLRVLKVGFYAGPAALLDAVS